MDWYDRQVIAEFRAQGGRVGRELSRLSLLLLHHTGARTGTERVTPLAYWPVTDRSVAVLASNRGAPNNPDWYYNLLAYPTAMVEIGSDVWNVRARVATPGERQSLLQRIVASSSSVRAVQHTTREIPVVILDAI